MGQVVSSATMSLDGFIAYDDNTVGDLFEWYGNGDVEVPAAGDFPPFRMTRASADHWTRWTASLGALVVGRTLFDFTDGWQGQHPLGVPVVVLTHQPPTAWSYPGSEDFHFVTEGIEAAIAQAQAIAGERTVGVAAGTVAGQVLDAGLLDAAAVDLVPLLMRSGRRYFGTSTTDVARLGDPTSVVIGRRVVHLVFPVPR